MPGTALLLLALALAPSAGADFASHYRDAVAAYRAGDAAAFLAAAQAAQAERPDSPQAAYLLAAASAMAGESEAALALLRGLADQGLSVSPGGEAAFEPLALAERAPALLERLARNGEPQGDARVEARLADGRFAPEGIAWDAARARFLLGSIHQRRIVAVGSDGVAAPFVGAGAGGLLSVFGMRVDQATDRLWVATAGVAQSAGIEPDRVGRSGIVRFDLAEPDNTVAYWLPEDGAEHVLGDLLLLDGDLLATDSLSGAVWRLDPVDGTYTQVLPPGRLISPQGLAPGPDSDTVYLADYRGGLFLLDLRDGALRKLPEGGTTHHGIDGLYRAGPWLIAVQNGVRPHRIMALALNAAGDGVTHHRVLAAALPDFDEPTLGVVRGDRFFFVANSHWPRFDAQGRLPDGLDGPVLLSVALP